jgi:hypothetical protein
MSEMRGRFEVWFLSDQRISVFVETGYEPSIELEIYEAVVFAAIAAGIIANLPKAVALPLCRLLADYEVPATREDIPTSVGDRVLVLPQPDRDRKGFEGTVKMKPGALPVSRMKTRGFGLFGRDVQDYARDAAIALFLHVLLGLSDEGRAMLVAAARSLGGLGLAGAIGLTTHPHAAWTAVNSGIDAAYGEAAAKEAAITEDRESTIGDASDAERRAIEDWAKANPAKVFREGGNWMVRGSGLPEIMCPRCWNGGGGTLDRVRLKGSDELFYLCDECDALWPVEQFEWDNYRAGLMDRSQALEARGLRGDEYELVSP